MLPAGWLWRPSAKALWQVVWSIWMLAVLPIWPDKIFKFLSMLITGQYLAGFFMLVYLLEIDSPLVALMPFWSIPYLLKSTNRLSLLVCTRYHTQDNTAEMCTKFRSSSQQEGDTPLWGYILWIYSLDTNWRPLEYNMRLFVSAWRPRKLPSTPSFLVWEAQSMHLILWIIGKSSALTHKKAHKTILKLHAHSVLHAHKLTTIKHALERFTCSKGLGLEQGAACHPPDPH